MDLWSAWNLLLFIIGFGSLIFVHELGHFLVAKWVGIRCTQFAIGFGQAVLCYRRGIGYRVGTTEPEYERRIEQYVREKRRERGIDAEQSEPQGEGEAEAEGDRSGEQSPRQITREEAEEAEQTLGLGETEYRLNWMPFGGYVKMVGQEDLDPKAVSDDPRAYTNKPIWARMCVISAGVVMNAVFAVLFFMVAFMVGVNFPPAIVGSVASGSPAAQAPAIDQPDVVGLEPGDRVVAINNSPTTDFVDLRIASALARPEQTLYLDVERPRIDGEPQRLQFAITPVEDEEMGLLHIGLGPSADLRLDASRQWPQLEAKGLAGGMRLVAVDSQPVQEHWEYRRRFQEAQGRPLELTFENRQRNGEEADRRTITLQPETALMRTDGDAPQQHLLGLQPATQINGVIEHTRVFGMFLRRTPAFGNLQYGDVIASLEGVAYPSLQQVTRLIREAGDQPVSITVLRDGRTEQLELTPQGGRLGVELGTAASVIRGTLPDTPFAALQLPAGTTLVAVDDEPIESLSDLRAAIQHADPGRESFQITYRLPIGDLVETQEVALDADERAALAELDWADNLPFVVLEVPQQTSNPITAIALGVDKTQTFMVQTYITINRLFVGTVRVEHLRGPVGIVDEGTRFAERGLGYLMFFLGLISINLAVINFLPLPIVDGGHALLLMWEKVRGKPAPPEVQSALTVVGLLLIGALFVTVTFYDVARLFTGG